MVRSLIGLVVLLSCGAASGDAAADAAWAKLTSTLNAAKSVVGVTEFSYGNAKRREVEKFAAMRPNYIKLETPDVSVHCDGTTWWTWYARPNQYRAEKAGKAMGFGSRGFEPFSGDDGGYVNGKSDEVNFAGHKCLAIARSRAKQPPTDYLLYVDTDTGLPVGWEEGAGESKIVAVYTGLVLDAPLTARDFAWKPPAGTKKYVQPDYSAKLLKVKSRAPQFALKTPSGDTWSLADEVGKHKVTLVNFWFHG